MVFITILHVYPFIYLYVWILGSIFMQCSTFFFFFHKFCLTMDCTLLRVKQKKEDYFWLNFIIFCLWKDAQSKYYFLLAKFSWESLSDRVGVYDGVYVCVCVFWDCKVNWRNSEYLLKCCVQIQALEFKRKNKNLLAEYLEERIYICLLCDLFIEVQFDM